MRCLNTASGSRGCNPAAGAPQVGTVARHRTEVLADDLCAGTRGTIDLVKAHAAKQRGEGADEEAKAAKKKLQREQSMKDADPFGPSIPAR